jgi:hypothetical protein
LLEVAVAVAVFLARVVVVLAASVQLRDFL